MADEFVQVVKFSVDDSELVAAIERMRKAFGDGPMGKNPADSLQKGLKKAGKEAQKTAKEAANIGKATKKAAAETKQLTGAFEKMTGAVKGLVAAYAGLRGISALVGFGKGSIEEFTSNKRQEIMLDTVLRNAGMTSASGYIKNYANKISRRSTLTSGSLVAGAAELSTYIKDPELLSRMMDLLADYSMGMTGGAELSPEAVTNLATGLGKAFDGTFDAMRKKGFDTSELEIIAGAQKLIEDIEKGNVSRDKKTGELKLSNDDKELLEWWNEHKGQNIDELKIAALENAMSDWKGLSDEFANTDEGRIIKLKNDIADLRAEVGKNLLPVVAKLASDIKSKLPEIKKIFESLGRTLSNLADSLQKFMPQIFYFATELSKILEVFSKAPVAITATVIAVNKLSPALAAFIGETTIMGRALKGLGGKLAITAAAAWGFFQILKAGDLVMKLGKDSARGREITKAGNDLNSWLNVKNTYAGKLEGINEILNAIDSGNASDSDIVEMIRSFGGKFGESFEGEGLFAGLFGYNRSLDLKNFNKSNAKELFKRMYKEDSEDLRKADAQIKKARERYDKAIEMDSSDMSKYWQNPEYGAEEDFEEELKRMRSLMKEVAIDTKGDTTVNNINYTNNIEVNSDELAKQVKENLKTLLTSQLTFVSRSETARAMAL
jgi:hypothetical protein